MVFRSLNTRFLGHNLLFKGVFEAAAPACSNKLLCGQGLFLVTDINFNILLQDPIIESYVLQDKTERLNPEHREEVQKLKLLTFHLNIKHLLAREGEG